MKTKGIAWLLIVSLVSGCASPGIFFSGSKLPADNLHWFNTTHIAGQQSLQLLAPGSQVPWQNDYQVSPVARPPKDYSSVSQAPILSVGDKIRLSVAPSFDSEAQHSSTTLFSGVYEIDIDGKVALPYLPQLRAEGLTLQQLEFLIKTNFERSKIFRPGMSHFYVTIVEWAPVAVYISGAVFSPGQTTINVRKAETSALQIQNTGGDFPSERLLTTALKSAGGVRPDADIRRVQVQRGDQIFTVDLTGVVLGYPVERFSLIEGDMVRIPSVGSAQRELLRPSAITPPGIRIFISNLTVPARNNAASAVGKESTSLPYGSRLLTASVSGNCAGGTYSTNSGRIAVLVTQNPRTQELVAIERKIEDMLRAPQRNDINPYLQPNDSVVCYDSEFTNFRDVAGAVADILFPFSWITRGNN